MILIKRLYLISRAPFLGVIAMVQPPSYFSTAADPKRLKQLHRKLLENASQIKTSLIIESMHQLACKCQLMTESELEFLLQKTMGNVGSLNHCQLTLLLQTISHYPRYSQYSRNSTVFRILLKRFNAIHSLNLHPYFCYRMLHALEKLQFPTLILNRYALNLLHKHKNLCKQMSALNILRIFAIFIDKLEIPVHYVNDFYDRYVAHHQYSEPKELCHLYYILIHLSVNLGRKYTHFTHKMRVHDLLLNPFHGSQLNDRTNESVEHVPEEVQTINEQKPRDHQQGSPENQKVREITNAVLSKISQKFILQKIERELGKIYGYQHESLTVPLAMLVSSVPELAPRITQFTEKHYTMMLPYEFIEIVRNLPIADNTKLLYTLYREKMWRHMSLRQKLKMMESELKCGNLQSINKQNIISTLNSVQQIDERDLKALQFTMRKYVPSSQYQTILGIVLDIVEGRKTQ